MSTAHLWLSINVGSDPIEGELRVGDLEPRPFFGWVELAAAIEAAHDAKRSEPSTDAFDVLPS